MSRKNILKLASTRTRTGQRRISNAYPCSSVWGRPRSTSGTGTRRRKCWPRQSLPTRRRSAGACIRIGPYLLDFLQQTKFPQISTLRYLIRRARRIHSEGTLRLTLTLPNTAEVTLDRYLQLLYAFAKNIRSES